MANLCKAIGFVVLSFALSLGLIVYISFNARTLKADVQKIIEANQQVKRTF